MTCFFSLSKIENEIKKKGNKYLYFLKLTDEKDLWIGFIEFLSQCPLFWFFSFSCYLLNKRNYAMTRKEEKSKQWIFWNKLKTQLTIFRLRFSQKNFIAWKSNIKINVVNIRSPFFIDFLETFYIIRAFFAFSKMKS